MRKCVLFLAVASTLSVSAAQPVNNQNGRLFRLFTPLTFYHSVANNQFSIDEQRDEIDQAVDRALLNVYLNRPDLVEATDTELAESGTLRDDIEKPIEQKVELTEMAAPMPDAPEMAAPEGVVVTKPKFWTRKGDGFLQFMQNYISDNWYQGGESNNSLLGNLTLQANYDNKSKWKWDNKLEMKLGFRTAKSDTVHKFKTYEDQIRLTSKLGLQASKRWYYTLQLIGYTQFTRGLKSNDHHIYSDFMSPLNLTLGIGMDYKVEALDKKLTGTVNLSPLTFNYRYVARDWFNDGDWFPSRYGIDEGKHHLFDLGSQITADLEWKMSETVRWKSRFSAFSSYKRTEVEWENTFVLQVSKYITANIFLYPRFDDSSNRHDDLGYWQFKEFTSIGFNYTF